MSRRPFTLFEVEKVAEYPEPGGHTFCEPVTSAEDQLNADDEAIRQFYTVYGYRPHEDESGGLLPDGGLFVIFDTEGGSPEDGAIALDLAYALADGKPVVFRGSEVNE